MIRLLSVLSLCLMLMAAGQGHAQALRIGSWDPAADPLTIGSEAALAKAYDELKQPVVFVALPLRRAMSMMLSGELDGNLHRIAELAQQEPGLVRVATPLQTMVIRLYAGPSGGAALQWQQLSGKRVGYRRGVLVIERHLAADVKRIEAKTDGDALRMLTAGLVDVVLTTEPAYGPVHPLALSARLSRQEQVLLEVPLYHYLRGNHRALAERLDVVLKRMQQSGELDALLRRAAVPAN
jgi:polar amino acid transport system substrate-binding protein